MRQVLPLHDAAFKGAILGEKSAELHFVQSDGASYVVELAGIDAMQMDDFREGNIVTLFETLSGDVPLGSVGWDRLYPSPHPSAAEEYQRRHEHFLQGKISSIREGHLTLVQMIPAVGADLIAVCERVTSVEG